MIKKCVSGLKKRKERTIIINTILFQKYYVLSLLGSGSSSSVYLAEHLKLKQYRAIKCIPRTHPRIASNYLEASLLKNLRHPGIPMIYDIEEDDIGVYIIEEYIPGESLSAFVQSQSNISQETIISFGIQLCEIIEYLHNQKPNPVLYLDLKPEHIILCGKQLKLIDFGISTSVKEDGNIFQSCGTRGFAAPEQFQGCDICPQTDVFGIGAILYYMLTGENLPPYFTTSFSFPGYCSHYFKKIIKKAVSQKPQERFSDVGQLKQKLQKLSLNKNGKEPDTHFLQKIIVTGSQNRIGVTHGAISLASWLNHQKQNAVYEAVKDKNLLPNLIACKEGMSKTGDICTYQYFRGSLCKVEAETTCIAVQDYGIDIMSAAGEEADLMILMFGGRPWEMEKSIQAYEKLAGEEHLILICNYNDKQMAQKYAGIFQEKIFYFPFDPDPFAITKEKHRLFQQILKEGRR